MCSRHTNLETVPLILRNDLTLALAQLADEAFHAGARDNAISLIELLFDALDCANGE